MGKILAITNNVSRTGAPILLLNLLKILKDDGWTVNTLSRRKGIPLAKEFESISEVFGFYPDGRKKTFKKFLKDKARNFVKPFRLEKFLDGVDLVLNNTITNGEVLEKVRRIYSGTIVSYIHELETFGLNDKHADKVIKSTDYFIVPSNAVKAFLINSFAIKEDRIFKLNSYIPPITPTANSAGFKSVNKITAPFIVGAAGTLDWRKGSDLFLQVARLFFNSHKDVQVQFIWVGADRTKEEFKRFEYDLRKLSLNDKVILLEPSNNIGSFFETIDLFLLTSREDPYPLVVLEAAAHKVPSVCFKNAGGIPEFVEEDAGKVVNYIDVCEMVSAIDSYRNNREELTLHGKNAYDKVKRLHHDKEVVLNQFKNIQGVLQ